ncbi:MAG: metallophosphoesterase [Bernardetiaceae bacterium]|nr:metallophosphoesterase [Bernardetiaceae bacterium]
MQRLTIIAFTAVFFLLIDLYVFQGIKVAIQHLNMPLRRSIIIGFWLLNVATIAMMFTYNFIEPEKVGNLNRSLMLSWVFVYYFSKVFGVLIFFIEDISRGLRWIATKMGWLSPPPPPDEHTIPRSEFVAKAGVIAMTAPLVTMGYGIISGAHDYRVRHRSVYLPHLPSGFDGIRIAQISDVHSGSFFNPTAVKGGVEMLMAEKPDIVFFTGDLVNNRADEMKDYKAIFEKIKAPLGVYSVLGNHDYGDYVPWQSEAAKRKNLADLKQTQKEMGWKLLMNENHILKQGGEQLAIIGIENWGARGRFPKNGKLELAHKGTEEAAVKLLLSHDPSHWDAQVNGSKAAEYREIFDKLGIQKRRFEDIDVTFAGHTHGFQFGIDTKLFKWSPVQYVYEQWADLYQKEHQYLYVNRGFGYLGFPGRIGMLPEITILTLKKGKAS